MIFSSGFDQLVSIEPALDTASDAVDIHDPQVHRVCAKQDFRQAMLIQGPTTNAEMHELSSLASIGHSSLHYVTIGFLGLGPSCPEHHTNHFKVITNCHVRTISLLQRTPPSSQGKKLTLL